MTTAGQVAYAAYVKHCGGVSVYGEPLPSWNDQRPEVREHWEAAARAVEDWARR